MTLKQAQKLWPDAIQCKLKLKATENLKAEYVLRFIYPDGKATVLFFETGQNSCRIIVSKSAFEPNLIITPEPATSGEGDKLQ